MIFKKQSISFKGNYLFHGMRFSCVRDRGIWYTYINTFLLNQQRNYRY